MHIKKIQKYVLSLIFFLLMSSCDSSPYVDLQGKVYRYHVPKHFVRSIRGSLYGFPVGGDNGSKILNLEIPWNNSEAESDAVLSVMIAFDHDYSTDGGIVAWVKRGKLLDPYKKIKEESGYFVYEHGFNSTQHYFTFEVNEGDAITTLDDFHVSIQKLSLATLCDLMYVRDGMYVQISPLRPSLSGSDPRRCLPENFKSIKQTVDNYLNNWKVNE